jgi:hypothetical protein
MGEMYLLLPLLQSLERFLVLIRYNGQWDLGVSHAKLRLTRVNRLLIARVFFGRRSRGRYFLPL